MAVRTLLFALFLLVPRALFAQVTDDSTIVLPDFTISATRTRIAAADAPARVTLIGRDEIDRSGATTLADVLGSRSGVYLKRLGPSGAATLSIRGSSASQTLVLLDGFRLSSPMLGQLDVTLIPSMLLESVEVMHGAASPLFGTDGMGGVVNLRSGGPADASFRVMLGAGAFGEKNGGLALHGTRNGLNLQFVTEYAGAEGDFSYRNPATAQTETRKGADYTRFSVFTSAGRRSGLHDWKLSVLGARADRGLPGLASATPAGERQWDDRIRAWASDEITLRHASVRLGTYVDQASLRYLNPMLSLDETGRTFMTGIEAELRADAGTNWQIGMGTALSAGTATHPSYASGARELQAALFTHATGRLGRLRMYPALRIDRYLPADGRTATPISPRLGLNLRPLPGSELALKVNAGRTFRTPTFNDRFWQPGGNPDLRPERGWTTDTGFMWPHGAWTFELTGFASHIRDQIVWLPDGRGIYTAKNISTVSSRGAEASIRWKPARGVDADLIYTYTEARDRSTPGAPEYDQLVPFLPREQMKAGVHLVQGAFDLDLNGRYAGRRYLTADGTQYIDPYYVLDARAGASVAAHGLRAHLTLGVENLFDHDYAIMPYYPMPGRHAHLRLILQPHSSRR